jgi:ATP-dependent Lon protease
MSEANSAAAAAEVLSLPVLPLKNTVLLPFMFMPLAVGRPNSRAAIEAALASEEKMVFVVAQRDAALEAPGFAELYPIGVRAVIKKMNRSGDTVEVLVQGIDRAQLLKGEQTEPYLKAVLKPLPLPTGGGDSLEPLSRAVIDQARRVLELARPDMPVDMSQLVAQAGDSLRLAYLLASLLGLDMQKEQALLEADRI